MPKLLHVEGDVFDFLGGKGWQAAVRIGEDGAYEVVGPPRRQVSKHRVTGYSLETVRRTLHRMDPETLAARARAARKARGGVSF